MCSYPNSSSDYIIRIHQIEEYNMKGSAFIIVLIILGCNTNSSLVVYPDGGYDIPVHIAKEDSGFYYYPIRDLESTRDSFDDAFYERKFFDAFGEPNLSIASSAKPIFRFSYQGWTEASYMITISENYITIKKGNRTDYLHQDLTQLTETENTYLNIFEGNIPGDKEMSAGRKRFVDSMLKSYPKLNDIHYYRSLLDKAFIPCETPFTYTLTKILISRREYARLANLLNGSGFWNLPFKLDCKDIRGNSVSLVMEANTGKKYNIVKFRGCYDQSTPFTKACQELLKSAKVDDEIRVDMN
jgi:hypothetical protein